MQVAFAENLEDVLKGPYGGRRQQIQLRLHGSILDVPRVDFLLRGHAPEQIEYPR